MRKLFLMLFFITTAAWAQLPNLTACDTGNGYGVFDLDVQIPIMIAGQGGNHLVTFHSSLAEATLPSNPIQNSHAYNGTDGEVIYARDQNVTANTHTIAPFNLILSVPQPHLQDGRICQNIFGAYTTTVLLNTGLSQGQYSFAWTYNGEYLPNANQSTYLAWLPGTYTVFATRGDNCTGSATCVISPTVMAYSAEAIINGSTVTLLATPSGDFEYSIDNDIDGYQASNVFENIAPGHHIGYVRDFYGCSELAFFFDTTLSTAAHQFKDFSYGPNPVSENLMLSNGGQMDHICVYNVLGQPVFATQLHTKDLILDCSKFNSGVYFVKVISGNGEQTFRILKK